MPLQNTLFAAIKATCIWLTIYIFFAHCLVIWKLQTPPSSNITTLRIVTEQEIEQLDVKLTQLRNAISDVLTTNSILEEHLSNMGRLIRATDQVDEVLQSNDEKSMDDEKILKLRQLLEIPDLAELRSSDQVLKTFTLARSELVNLIEQNDWNALANYFAMGNLTRNVIESCSTVQELDEAEARIAQAFASQREGGLPVSFSETVARIRESLIATVNGTIDSSIEVDNLSSIPDTTTTNKDECMKDLNRVISWLEAGIMAVDQKQDRRRALFQALEKDGIDTSQIILDADLEDNNMDSNKSSSTEFKSVNLRQLLDTPTLHEGSYVIDNFLEWISGRSDGLDGFLDKVVFANVPDSGERAVSRTFVKFLLKMAGHVEVPVSTFHF